TRRVPVDRPAWPAGFREPCSGAWDEHGLDLDLASEHLDGLAAHVHVAVAVAPFDREVPADEVDEDAAIGASREDAGDRGRARAGAAGGSLARAALPHPHVHLGAAGHADELGIHALRKPLVLLEARPDGFEIER